MFNIRNSGVGVLLGGLVLVGVLGGGLVLDGSTVGSGSGVVDAGLDGLVWSAAVSGLSARMERSAGATGPVGSAASLPCAHGGSCAVGDAGPGGGIVFYAAASVQSWGQYLEVALTLHSAQEPRIKWCSNTSSFVPSLADGSTTAQTTGTAIGTGWSNTRQMVSGCADGAANSVRAYGGGGKSDWFLPSRDELNALHVSGVGGLDASHIYFWSSSQFNENTAWGQAVGVEGGWRHQNTVSKGSALPARPVRAFRSI